MNKEVCLFGAGGHGKVIKDIAERNSIEVVGFFDDAIDIFEFSGVKVFNSKEMNLFDKKHFVISIGNNKTRSNISKSINIQFTSLIDKSACISKSVTIQKGTVVMPNAVINSDTIIGEHCIINTSSVIEHDCILGDFVHISPSATLTGNVSIGEGTHIGAGSVVIPGVKIGKWVTVGAGAVILKDIPDYAVVVGNPGKIIRYINE